MELNCYRLLLVVTLLGIAYGEVVNHFIRHYEPLHYDRDDLMYHHRRLRRSLVGPNHISLQFNAFGRSFDLALKPEKKLLHPNFTLIIDNHVVRDHQLKSFLYTGKDRDDASVTVHGNMFHDVFEGTIYTPDEEYHIEPADRYVNDSSYHSIIYRGSDLDLSTVAGATCGSTHEDIKQELLKTQMIGRARDKGHRLRKRQQNRPYPQFPNAEANKARCWLNVIGDYKFVQSVGGQGTAMAQLLNIIQQASLIYEGTAFNPAGSPIHFGIQRIMVEPSPPPSGDPFANEFLGVQSFLDLHSRGDFSDFCLSYRFTNRDFDNGVVGLAYIGQALGSNAAGGICDNPITQNGIQKTLNTGIVTNLNFGRQIPPSLSVLTFAHEVGHNFGSNHDPMDSPPGGAYIMSAFATDGSQPNNDNFSPRSIEEMTPVVRTRGQDADNGCFLPGDNMCGNRLIDEGEDCDCGSDRLTDTGICMDDSCCNGSSCRVADTAACSPEQGPCCTTGCTFRDSTFMCSNDTECALAQMCNGMNATCPAAEPRVPMGNDTLRCNNGENVCVDGVCSGSICLALGPNITACECVGNAMEACEECCMFSNGSCISTFAIANADATLAERLPNGQGRNLQIGFPCKNFTGYCDFFNQCMIVDNDGAINRLFDFFLNSATFQQAIDWIVNMWWVVLIVLVGLLVIMFVIVVIFHIILPRPKYRRKAAAKRRQQRTVPLDKYPGGHGGPQYHRY